MQRLSQTVLDLQSALTGFTSNLRTDMQDDTKKMLVTLLNNMHPPDTAANGGTEESPAVLDGHQASRGGTAGDRALEKIVARLDEINNALKGKDEALEDLRGTLTSHEGQIRVLMDASQSQTPAMVELDVIQNYIDGKFDKLKKEIDDDIKEQLANAQGLCSDKIQTLQKTCEGNRDQGLVSLSELVDNKEADLRKEIRALRLEMAAADGPVRTQRQTDSIKKEEDHRDHKDLWREIDRIAEAHRVLNARIDNELAHLSAPKDDSDLNLLLEDLEARINVTEQNAETHCFYIEEKLTRSITEEVGTLQHLLDERLDNMEDQFTNMLVEMSNNSLPGMFADSVDAIQAQVTNNKFLLQGLDDKINTVGELCSAGCSSSESPGDARNPLPPSKGLENLWRDLNRHRNDVDVLQTDVNTNTDKLGQLEATVERQSTAHDARSKMMDDFKKELSHLQDNLLGLSGAVTGLSDSLSKYNQDMNTINATCCHVGQRGPGSPVPSGQVDATSRQVEELRNRLDTLSQQVTSELGESQGLSRGLSAVDGRLTTLEKECGRLVGVGGDTELKGGLGKCVLTVCGIVPTG